MSFPRFPPKDPALDDMRALRDLCDRLISRLNEIDRREIAVIAREEAVLGREWEATHFDTRNGSVATEYHNALEQLPRRARDAKKSMP